LKSEKIYDQTFFARNFNTSPLTISGLEGDLYDYEFIIKTDTVGSDTNLLLRCNGDSTSNYRVYYMQGNGSSAAASVDDSGNSIQLNNALGTAQQGFISGKLTGSSGDERYFDLLWTGDGRISKTSGYWKNTADEVTSFSITASASITVDAHIVLYRTLKDASQERWELVETKSWTSSNSDQTFTVDGDGDIQYKVIIKSDGGNFNFRLNSDSGSNYTRQNLKNIGGSISAANSTLSFAEIVDSGDINDAEIIINAESGVERLCLSSVSGEGVPRDQSENAIWWSNTADNLTSITLRMDLNTGTAKLYRRKNPKTIGDTLPFEMVERESFSSTDWSAGSTYTVAGDDVLLYKIEGLLSNASGDIEIRMELNSDTAANYPEQYLRGDTSTASAASATRNYIVLAKLQNGDQAEFSHYLYPKSGENRPMLTECSYDENAVEKLAHWWNNSDDGITSIKIYASSSNAITGELKLSRLMRSNFNPGLISNLIGWIDGDNGYTDLSTNGYTVTNNGTSITAAALNGHDIFNFDSASSEYISWGTQLGKPSSYTVAVLARVTNASTRQFVCASLASSGASATNWGSITVTQTGKPSGSITTSYSNGSVFRDNWTGASEISSNTWQVIIVSFNFGDFNSVVTIDNSDKSLSALGSGNNNSGTAYEFTMGRPGAFNGVYMTGDIAEMAIYDRELSFGEKNKLYNYFKNKYGI
tara:strand:+ start:1833 stop:3944 length:2112 start_codon:yes stop_codon:yes gene_type:complete